MNLNLWHTVWYRIVDRALEQNFFIGLSQERMILENENFVERDFNKKRDFNFFLKGNYYFLPNNEKSFIQTINIMDV
jgi:hypothetical protein